MGPRSPQLRDGDARPQRQAFTPLVECAVRVSPALARLIRKCAAAESEGASARDALLVSAGVKPGDMEELRAGNARLSSDLAQERETHAHLQASLIAVRAEAAKHESETRHLRKQIRTLEETTSEHARIGQAHIAALGDAIARHEEAARRSVPLDGLDEQAARAMVAFRTNLERGDDVRAAALGAAGYEPGRVDAALARQDSLEARAFDAAMERRDWRRRAVLWLLQTPSRKA